MEDLTCQIPTAAVQPALAKLARSDQTKIGQAFHAPEKLASRLNVLIKVAESRITHGKCAAMEAVQF